MRKLFALTLVSLMTCMSYAQSGTGMERTAMEVAREMAPGWNLGNTMEGINWRTNVAPIDENYGIGTETNWQSTKTTADIIRYVKAQGFRSIRIPCGWRCGHISDAATHTIDAAWMARVKEVVDYCINEGLYVVLNDHYDGGWIQDRQNIEATGEKKEEIKSVLANIWTQIATAFRDYDEHLLFAGLNEPNAETQAATNNLVEYEQVFINAVRATGGNNEKRILIVQGPNTDIDKTCDYLAGKMPEDPTPDRLMVEIHYYGPWQFWGMEKDEWWGKVFYYWGQGNHVEGSVHNATTGEEDYMEAQLEKMKTRFQDKGYPVYIGEFGANWRTITGAGESQEKHNASIKCHYKTLIQKSMERGMVPVVWDTNYLGSPSMTIIDRKNLKIHNPYMMEGIKEAVEAVEATGISTVHLTSRKTDGYIYDLQGRRVNSQAIGKGIYIVDGKKYIKK